MPITPIAFETDGLRLSGTLHRPAGTGMPLVVGSHGLLGTSDSAKQMVLADACVNASMAYFRFDHRGCGNSDGDLLVDTSLDSRRRDLVAAVGAVRELTPVGRALGLFGSSFGGAVCLRAAAELNAAAVVCCAAPVHTRGIHLPPDDFHRAVAGAIPPFDLSGAITHAHGVLIFHGEHDEVVPVENARIIYAAVSPPKELVIHTDGDHRMSDPRHQLEFADRAVDWFRSRLV